jgi:uncharacterized protein (TIGR00369 family)
MEIFGAVIPFADHCGVEPLDIGNGRSRLRLALKPEHGNNLGIAHGGLICTLLDSKVMRPVMTLDMQVSFLAPGRGVLLAEGRVLRAGRTVVFCEAEVRDEAGELVAKASGLFKPTMVREARPDQPGGAGSDRSTTA